LSRIHLLSRKKRSLFISQYYCFFTRPKVLSGSETVWRNLIEFNSITIVLVNIEVTIRNGGNNAEVVVFGTKH